MLIGAIGEQAMDFRVDVEAQRPDAAIAEGHVPDTGMGAAEAADVVRSSEVGERRQGAIMHWESRAPKRKVFEFDIGYQDVRGLWLPETIAYTKYRPQPENPPELFCRLNVTRVEPNVAVSADIFSLEPEEGMIVWNATTAACWR